MVPSTIVDTYSVSLNKARGDHSPDEGVGEGSCTISPVSTEPGLDDMPPRALELYGARPAFDDLTERRLTTESLGSSIVLWSG